MNRWAVDGDDLYALAAGFVLWVFLIALKILLLGYWLAKDLNPLADAPPDAIFLIGAADLMVFTLLAGCYFVLRKASRRLPPLMGAVIRGGAPFVVHTAIVIFATASFMVATVYGWPLTIDHMRTADDLRVIGDSLGAYLGALPIVLTLIGCAMYAAVPVLVRRLQPAASGRHRVRTWTPVVAVSTVMFGLWVTRLDAIDTFGVKDNALIFFVRQYEPVLQPIDARREAAALARELGTPDLDGIPTGSLRLERTALAPDFDFNRAVEDDDLSVLMIQLESTSAQYLDPITTPNLMRIGARGVTFARHATVYTESIRATYALHWSDYIGDLGTSPRLVYERPFPQTSLAEVLRRDGYATAFLHSGFLSWGDYRYLFENSGFETVVDAAALARDGEPLPWSWGVHEERTVEALTSWLSAHKHRRFFAVYAMMFPHHPYLSPLPESEQPFPNTSWVNRYRNSLHYADRNIGRVLDFVEAEGMLDRTVIVVAGDHGETVATYPVGHGIGATLEEIRTPFIVSNPGLVPRAQRSVVPTSHLDVAPTIAGIVGVDPDPDWLGRRLFADTFPATATHVTVHLSRFTGLIDNGMFAVFSDSGSRRRLFAVSPEGLVPADHRAGAPELLEKYRARDLAMQKWIRYRHFARATQSAGAEAASNAPSEDAQ